MAKVIHTMIRVLDLKRSPKFCADVLGLHEAHRLDFPDFALVYLRNADSDFEVELTLSKGRVDPYTHWTGYGHICALIANAAATQAAVLSKGHEPAPIKGFKTPMATRSKCWRATAIASSRQRAFAPGAVVSPTSTRRQR